MRKEVHTEQTDSCVSFVTLVCVECATGQEGPDNHLFALRSNFSQIASEAQGPLRCEKESERKGRNREEEMKDKEFA